METFDVVIIGAGPGGIRLARLLGKHQRTLLIENQKLGGTCVNRGCVPKKIYHGASHFIHDSHNAPAWGFVTNTKHSLATLYTNTQAHILHLNKVYQHTLQSNEVTLYTGTAHVQPDATIIISTNDKTHIVRANKIVLATGTLPSRNNYPGVEHTENSDDFFTWQTLPSSVLVEGGGYIALELANILHNFGASVEICIREAMLRGMDVECVQKLQTSLIQTGIPIHLGHTIQKITQEGENKHVTFFDAQKITFDKTYTKVLSAIGRHPNLPFDPSEFKTIFRNEQIQTNSNYQTSIPWLYAIGDISSSSQNTKPLASVAIAQAKQLAHHFLTQKPCTQLSKNVPTAVFTTPEFASVGLTEEQARQLFPTIEVYAAEYYSLQNALSKLPGQKTFQKLIIAPNRQIVGAHMVGTHASEQIQLLATLLDLSCTKEQLDSTIPLHPVMAEEWVTMSKPRS